MSNQEKPVAEPKAAEPKLSKEEQDELKALQEERKESGGHITDSQRARLSELQAKEEPEPKAKAAPAAKK